MGGIDPGLWDGAFEPWHDAEGRRGCRLEGSGSFAHMPLRVDPWSVYRFRMLLRNTEGNGRLYFNIRVGEQDFPSATLDCPIDPSWHVFEVDAATGRCARGAPALFRVGRFPAGSGTVLVCQTAMERLPQGVGPTPEPRLVAAESDDCGPKPVSQYAMLMEEGMDEFDQQFWRGKNLVAKKDERGAKCLSMEGDRAIIFVPVRVEPNSVYRCHLDLRRETGNGKAYCNLYANRSFDFPQVPLLCEIGNWGTYDIQLRTGAFPPNLPIVLRLWRSPAGTGSLLVRRIALEKLPAGTPAEEPKLVVSSSMERLVPTPLPMAEKTILAPKAARVARANRPPPIEVLPHRKRLPELSDRLSYSCFDREPTRVLIVSETGDENAMREAFDAAGLPCESMPLAGDAPRLPDLLRNKGTNWAHFHLRRGTALTSDVVGGIRNARPGIVITMWVEPGWPLFDDALLRVLRGADLALVGSDVELATWRAAGCFNAELWDPGAADLTPSDGDSGYEVVALSDDPSDPQTELAAALAGHFGARAVFAPKDNAGRRHALAGAQVAVFADQWPSSSLFGLLAAGLPVLARRSLGTMEWCRDGIDLRLFDTADECAAMASQLLDDQGMSDRLGAEGASTALEHTRVARAKELAVRLGCFEAVMPCFPRDRTSYAFKHVLCAMRAAPPELMARSGGDVDFVAASFTECRDLAAKIVRFNPDLLHIHLEAAEDGLPWRDLLLDLRRRMPHMLVSAWHPGRGTDGRMMDLRFSVDHLLVGDAASVRQYHAASAVGAAEWSPEALPSENPAAFRDAVCSLARGMEGRRDALLKGANGRMVDLTVFIGTCNRYDQLRRAVETAFASAGDRPVEVVVNDAGSTDGTQDWMRRMAATDRRFVPIFSGKRTSFTQAFNEALQVARGRYICWLSDDIVSEGLALSDMCAVMDEISPIDMGGFCVRNSWGHEYTVRKDAGFYFPPVGCMHTETLRKLNGLNMDYPYYSQDTDLAMRILRLGGRVVACVGCRLLHNCLNDELRRSNSANHTNTMADMKYNLAAWRPGESARLPYPSVLLVPAAGCGPGDILRAARAIRAQYSNSHMSVGGEASGWLDTRGPNSFLRKVPTTNCRTPFLFDLVVEVGPGGNRLVRPSDRSDTPFVRKLLQG